MAVEALNSAGGIKSSDGDKLEMLYADSESKPVPGTGRQRFKNHPGEHDTLISNYYWLRDGKPAARGKVSLGRPFVKSTVLKLPAAALKRGSPAEAGFDCKELAIL